MTTQSVIIANPNSGLQSFRANEYLNPHSFEYTSSDSSSSSVYADLVPVPLVMANSRLTNIPFSSNVPYFTTEDEQRNQSQLHHKTGPYLTIEEEPKDQLRFRYESEKGKHGGLKPIIKLNDYGDYKNIFIKASLYTNEETPTLHVYELKGKTSDDGVCWQKLTKNYTAEFPSLSVCTKKKDAILSILEKRIKAKYKEEKKKINEQTIKKEAQEKIKSLNLNSCKLCFEAFLDKKKLIGDPVFSIPIFNQKCTAAGELKITRLSSCTGRASGGDEIILLCEKVRKDDIEICFFEEDASGRIVWEGKGEFKPADIHHQVAIPFKTPQFHRNIEREVQIKLYRKSDGKSGDSIPFTYIPNDEYGYDFTNRTAKRKKPNPPEDSAVLQDKPSTSTASVQDNSEVMECQEQMSTGSSFFDVGLTDSDPPSSSIDWPEDWKWDQIFADFSFSSNFPLVDDGDNLNMDAAIVDFASLTLSGTKIRRRPILPEQIQELKNGISNILQNRGNDSFLKILPILMTIKDENANTLLHLAVIEKSENLILLIRMLQVAPNLVNQPNKLKMTPLHLAVSKGLWKVVRILIRFGADPNIKNRDGNNCVHLAAKFSFSRCLLEVLAPLLLEKEENCFIDINSRNYEGLAPLHFSVMNESNICTEILIRAKADVNITDGKCGKTPLHIAYERDSKLIDYLLAQPKINPGVLNFKGHTPNSSVLTMCNGPKSMTMKPTECCIEISFESSSSTEDNCCENMEVTDKSQPITEEIEKELCKILDSNGLWKQLGMYVIKESELDMIAELDSTPTTTILKELKKRHGENYSKKLRYFLRKDGELKPIAERLRI